VTTRVIRVIVDPSGVTTGGRRVNRTLTGMDRNVGRLQSGFSSLARVAGGFIAAISVGQIIRTANTFQQLQNSLRVVTDSTDELTSANERLFAIAQATRTPIEATVQLFSRASIAADELGASQEELFRLTEITGQALAVQGGAASEASGALRQLSQSFSSGIVRAEEFNSILEGAFPLAQAAARGIDEAGGSVGRLRNLIVEGEITSQEFFRGILEGGEALEEQFAQTVPTVSQAITNLQTSFIGFIGELDTATGLSSILAQTILDLAGGLSTLGGALTGNLRPTEELSTNMERFAITIIAAGSSLSALFGILGVGRDFFVSFGEGLGGVAAGISQLAQGNFEEAGRIFNDTTAFDNARASTTDFFESFGQNIDDASLRISQILLPSFRDIQVETARIKEEEGILDPIIEETDTATMALDRLLTQLQQQTQELALQTALGDSAAEAIQRYRIEVALAAVDGGELGASIRAANEALIEQQQIAAVAADRQSNTAVVEALQLEFELIGLTNQERAIEIELRQLNGEATDEQIARVRELTEAIQAEQDQIDALGDFFTRARENAQDTLAGFLADPLAEGLDELPAKFAATLQRLAADALASELFSILAGLGGGGGGGGVLGFLGGLFGGRQNGGSFNAGQPFIAGEGGPGSKPELVVPTTPGRVFPAGQTAGMLGAGAPPTVNLTTIVVTDPNEIPSGIESPDGERAVMNVIQRNPQALRRIAG